MNTRTCDTCNQDLELSSNNFRPSGSGQLRRTCRKCENTERKKYKRSPESQDRRLKRKLYLAKYRAEHRERLREQQKLYMSNPEIRARKYQIDKERKRLKRLTGDHYPSAEDKTLKLLRKHKRRALERNLPHIFTLRDWQRAIDYFNGCCAVCGRPLRDLFGLHTVASDHWIPLISPSCPGTVKTNMVPLCHGISGCNNSKGRKNADEWLIEKFGKRRAREILKRIEAYFEWVKQFED